MQAVAEEERPLGVQPLAVLAEAEALAATMALRPALQALQIEAEVAEDQQIMTRLLQAALEVPVL